MFATPTAPPAAEIPPSVQASLSAAAAHYDRIPYASKPFAQSHPARIAGIARMFGIGAPDVATARILELGCASGGNLIPLAQAYPKCQCVGIDLSAVQISEGVGRAARLGLQNVELRQESITEVGAGYGLFDYIICHGVYSWVPLAVRNAILRVCQERLKPDGIAYVSYNVLPGWRQKQALRDAMLLYTGGPGSPDAAMRAREILVFLETHAENTTPYGSMVRAEVARLANLGDDYIVHEFLEADNAPCTFTEFAASAGLHKLAYLAEAELSSMLPESVSRTAAPRLREIASNRLIATEQCIDLITGRTFRQTLLVHNEHAAGINRELKADTLVDLHFTPADGFALKSSDEGRFTFGDALGRTLTTASAAVRDGLERMIERQPATSSLADLLRQAAPPAKKGKPSEAKPLEAKPLEAQPADGAARAELLDALFKMLAVGLLQVSAAPFTAARRGDRPRVLKIARVDAAAGLMSTVNSRHESITLDIVAQLLLPLLDGTNDMKALRQHMLAAEARNAVVFQRDGLRVSGEDAVTASVNEHIERVLVFSERAGLLEA